MDASRQQRTAMPAKPGPLVTPLATAPGRVSSPPPGPKSPTYRGQAGSVVLAAPPPRSLPPVPAGARIRSNTTGPRSIVQRKGGVVSSGLMRPNVPIKAMDDISTGGSAKPSLPAKPKAVFGKPPTPAKPSNPLARSLPGDSYDAKPQVPLKPVAPLKSLSPRQDSQNAPPVPSKPSFPPVTVRQTTSPPGSAATSPRMQASPKPPVPSKPSEAPLAASGEYAKPQLPVRPAAIQADSRSSRRLSRPALPQKPLPPEPPSASNGLAKPSVPRKPTEAAQMLKMSQESDESQSEDEQSTTPMVNFGTGPSAASTGNIARAYREQTEEKQRKKSNPLAFIRTMSTPNFAGKSKPLKQQVHPLAASTGVAPLSEEQLQATLPPAKKTKHLKSAESYFRLIFQVAIDLQFVSLAEVEALFPDEKVVPLGYRVTSKKFLKPFVNTVETFLNVPNVYFVSWSEVFYARMVHYQNVLSAKLLRALERTVEHYVQQLSEMERQSHLRGRSIHLFTAYVETHREDPDNSLLGLAPGRLARATYDEFLSTKDDKAQDKATIYTQEKLLDLITAWSQLDDLEKIGRKVKAFVSNRRQSELASLTPGSLLIVQLPEEHVIGNSINYGEEDEIETKSGTLRKQQAARTRELVKASKDNVVIARFVDRTEEGLLVWHTAAELEPVLVNPDTALPFTRDMLDVLGMAKSMKPLVTDGADLLNNYLKDRVKFMVEDYVVQLGIKSSRIKRANNNEATLLDLFALKEDRMRLTEVEKKPDELLNEVDAVATRAIAQFIESMQHKDLFQPIRSQTLSELGSWPYCSLAKSRLRRLTGVLDSALTQLEIEKRLVLNSTRKLQLSEWWLNLIRAAVKQLLIDNMYDFNAVNSDYIESPPDDMPSIQKNLELINEILNPAEDKHGIVENLVRPLTEKIYPKLDELVHMMYVVMIEQDFDHGQKSVDDFSLSQYEASMRATVVEEEGRLAPELVTRLQSLIKDVRYISEMKVHERAFGNVVPQPKVPGLKRAKSSFVMVDAVPVSGLIMNYFHRMEVELKTVIELWKDQDTIDDWHRKKGNPVPTRVSLPVQVIHRKAPIESPDSDQAGVAEKVAGSVVADRPRMLATSMGSSTRVTLTPEGVKQAYVGVAPNQLMNLKKKAIALPRPPSLMRESDSEAEEEEEDGRVHFGSLRKNQVLSPSAFAMLSPRSVRANADKLPPLPGLPPGFTSEEKKAEPEEESDTAEDTKEEEETTPSESEESSVSVFSLKKSVNVDSAIAIAPMEDDGDMIISGF